MELILKDTKNVFSISKDVFGCSFNKALIHQVVVAYLSGARKGTSAQKNRSEVSGSGKKPWRQKGTGRARSGSIRSPIWRSGGVTFASKPKLYNKKVNKKMYKGALKSIFSELINKDRLVVFENFSIIAPKTKLLINKLNCFFSKKILIIILKSDKNLFLAARNLYKVKVCYVKNINPISLITFDKIILTITVIKQIEEMLL